MHEYTIRECESGVTHVFMANDIAEAREEAEEWAREGDYDLSEGTIYVNVRLACDTDDGYESGRGSDDEEGIAIAIHQPEPECSNEAGHDWQSPFEIVGGIKENPGVWGHGGGVIINECCMNCGCKRRTDTWAQRRDTGEEGLTEVTYEQGAYELPETEEA